MKTAKPVLHAIRSRMNQICPLVKTALVALSLLTVSNNVFAVFSPLGCANNNVNVGLSRTGAGGGRTGGQAHVGEFIDYVVTIDNTAPFNCDVSGATVTLRLADGTSILVTTNLDIRGNASPSGGGDSFSCPGD